MEISPLKLAELLLFSFLFGGVVGAFNDILRISRVLLGANHPSLGICEFLKKSITFNQNNAFKISKEILFNVLIFIQDFLLLIFFTLGVILLNYYYNDGKIRFFSVLAMLLGFLIYYFTLGKMVMLLSNPIVVCLRTVICFFISIIILPIKFVGLCLKKIYIQTKKYIEKKLNLRYNKRVVKMLLNLSNHGFLNIVNKDSKNES